MQFGFRLGTTVAKSMRWKEIQSIFCNCQLQLVAVSVKHNEIYRQKTMQSQFDRR
jgi:hypothetical protein